MKTASRPFHRRLISLDRELRTGRFPTVEQLAALNEVDTKTIRRDLDYLRNDLHAPAAYNPKHRGWHYTSATFLLPAVLITEGELLALFLAAQVLQPHRGTPYESQLRTAINKLTELLPDEISLHWHAVEQAHSFRSSVTSLHDVDTFRRLADAVRHHRQLRLTYWTASRDAETERTVDPWHLACVDGEWYLIGWCHLRQARRMFAPARIRSLKETGDTFVVPQDFSIGEFFDGTFKVIREEGEPLQRVRLRFAPSAAKYVREKIWHASQTMHADADGHLTLELSLRSLIEVRRWILSWGAECEVLEPPALQENIAREAATIAARTFTADTVPRTESRTRPARKPRQVG